MTDLEAAVVVIVIVLLIAVASVYCSMLDRKLRREIGENRDYWAERCYEAERKLRDEAIAKDAAEVKLSDIQDTLNGYKCEIHTTA